MLSLSLTAEQTVGITFAAGESVSVAVTIAADGIPLILTGYTFKMTIEFGTPLLLTTANGGIVTLDATNGIAEIVITDTASGQFTPGSYSCDFWAITGATAIRLFTGIVNVLNSITAIP